MALIDSFPAEILVEIFRLSTVDSFPELWHAGLALSAELARIANAPLLSLSSVCSRWRSIVQDNPLFWSNIEIDGVTEDALDKTMKLLAVRLERSRDAPLSVHFSSEGPDDLGPHPRIFDFLVQHSHKWQTAKFLCSFEDVDTSLLRGRIPRLESLVLLSTTPAALDSFVTPSLERLFIQAPQLHSDGFSAIRTQLREFACIATHHDELTDVVGILPTLPDSILVHLAIEFEPEPQFVLPPVTAPNIGSLSCTATPYGHSWGLAPLFTSLTLPQLRKLVLKCDRYPRRIVAWPPQQHWAFLDMCQRSGFADTLKILSISQVGIVPADLIPLLVVLPALEHLSVGDSPRNDGLEEEALITDGFLRALMEPTPALIVPRLSYLACRSRWRGEFTHSFMVDFVLCRVKYLNPGAKFELCIRSMYDAKAGLEPESQTRLLELEDTTERFVYRWGWQDIHRGLSPQTF
ncbi:hypothetical protein FB45DRAFT_1036296 [Roridomyces roridus]|uniref:F-box domain-containing protein n=1 Tax=Roridomyces roridus TaxID=1738132 RepID=A0AAD7FBK9_9AGAR|nr:hypothetical protein FB45DRAFT_1036296 [Roridomyces roridus]